MRMTDFAVGLQYIGIPTADLAESLIFYTELGFDVIQSAAETENDRTACLIRLGDLTLKLYETAECAGCAGAVDHISIAVSNIDGAYDFICSRGLNNTQDEIHFLPGPQNGAKYFTIEGPSREKIEFSQCNIR